VDDSKGQSGNPHGKPKGTRHRITVAAETLLEGEAEAIRPGGALRAREVQSGKAELRIVG